jgi:hypothetical protein
LGLTKGEKTSVIGLAIVGIVSILLLLILLATETGLNSDSMNDIFWLVFMPLTALVVCAVASINQKSRVRIGKVLTIFGAIELSYVAVAYGIGFLLRNNHNANVHIDYYGLFPLTILIAIASIALGVWLLSTKRKLEKLKT